MKSLPSKNHFGIALVSALLLSSFALPSCQSTLEPQVDPTSSVPALPATATLTVEQVPTATLTRVPTASPSSTATATVTKTKTPTKTPSATATPSPTGEPSGIGAPFLSTGQLFFQGARCDPNRITIHIPAQYPDGIKVVVFFHRLHEVNTGKDSGWSEGLSMNTPRDGIYTLSVSGDRLIGDSGITTETRASYQFVIQATNGERIRSMVYTDLTLLPCGRPVQERPTPIAPEPPQITPGGPVLQQITPIVPPAPAPCTSCHTNP